jgi:hypothetical protein
MNEEKEKQMNKDVADPSERPVENERVEERAPESGTPVPPDGDDLAPLFEDEAAEKFRARWLSIQSKFVDDPRDSVQQADDLVEDVIKSITDSFARRRGAMEKAWSGGETSTEDLRQALKQYRSFFERLLAIKS